MESTEGTWTTLDAIQRVIREKREVMLKLDDLREELRCAEHRAKRNAIIAWLLAITLFAITISAIRICHDFDQQMEAVKVQALPVLVEYHPENRNDGLVLAYDESGQVFVVKAETVKELKK